MSGVLKNRKKREEAEAAAAAALTASANSNSSSNADDMPVYPEAYDTTGKKGKGSTQAKAATTATTIQSSNDADNGVDSIDGDKKGKGKKTAGGKGPSKTRAVFESDAAAGTKKRKRGESDHHDEEPGAKEPAHEANNKNAEVRINSKGNIDDEDDLSSSDEVDEAAKDAGSDAGSGEFGELTAAGKPRQKKFIKRRLRRYLSLEDKIAVFQRIVKDIDPKTKKLRYGASNEICGDYSIGRKTINNIKNLFEGLIREGKDLSTILTAETMQEIPSKLNVDLEAATQPLSADSLLGGDENDQESAKKALETLKQNLQLSYATNAASVSIEEDSDSDKEGGETSKLKVRIAETIPDNNSDLGEDGIPQNSKYKTLFDEETRMRKMLKVNNVGRQTKLNEMTVERIRTIVPYCYGVKELSDMYEREFGEKIHQSTLWRYCSELNIKIPKKTAKK